MRQFNYPEVCINFQYYYIIITILLSKLKVLLHPYISMDFLMKQQLITLNANCQLIQCTHITNLLSNLKGLLDSMIIKVSIVRCKMSHVHRCAKITKCSSAVPWLHCHLHLKNFASYEHKLLP